MKKKYLKIISIIMLIISMLIILFSVLCLNNKIDFIISIQLMICFTGFIGLTGLLNIIYVLYYIKSMKLCIGYLLITVLVILLIPFALSYKSNEYENSKTVYIGNKIIIYTGTIPQEAQKYCEKWIAKTEDFLPSKLFDAYKENFYIMDEKHFRKKHHKINSTVDAVAFLGFDKNNVPLGIYINADTILKQDKGMLVTVCHEFGHYLDAIMDKPSLSNEWASITKEEYQKLVIPNEYYKDPGEFFAETFAWYCLSLSEDSLGSINKKKCPQAWNYIDLIVKEYEQKAN